jgi:CHAT domain-containing protein
LQGSRLVDAQSEYALVRHLLQHGYVEKSQNRAAKDQSYFSAANPQWSARFKLLEAESMMYRGRYEEALSLFSTLPASLTQSELIEKLTFEASALAHVHRYADAKARLAQAEQICSSQLLDTCGEVAKAGGILATQQGDFSRARNLFSQSLSYSRNHHNLWLEASSLSNLGAVALQEEHYDEAADCSWSAFRAAKAISAEDLAQRSMGNIGWAFYLMGDGERSLPFFLDAEQSAVRLGDQAAILNWLTTAGIVYQEGKNYSRATDSYRQALILAKEIKSQDDVVNALEDIAHSSIDEGKIGDAQEYLQQLEPLVQSNGNRLDALDVTFAQARIAASQHRAANAESLFLVVERDPASQTSMRLGAEHALAALYADEGRVADADRLYRNALATFESARLQLKNEESKLPFLANATGIYDDYIHFLVMHGREDEALLIADQSRAQTLAQGLGVTAKSKHPLESVAIHPGAIARKANATLLFYWLGEKQSYLWAITANKTALFPLPPRREIAQAIERYGKTLLGFSDPIERADADGLALYRMLVAPASAMLSPGANVVVLNDGELSRLNFETLIVPGPHPHYWIEDATLVSAASLHLLAVSSSAAPSTGKLLLFGDAISPNPDYPELPMAAAEMKRIEQYFGPQNEAVYAREQATAPAYLDSNPRQFSYIHFVAHGVASRTDPLDSAIILSRASAAEDSFKLHAREIIQHPLQARLVTISACYGSGTRSYAGEGLVGLAWAFLRAGAHNVIGALWEANDESTAQLMGSLYQGIEGKMTPSAALRQAKLNLLHSHGEFRKPFYWAPFQIYTGL